MNPELICPEYTVFESLKEFKTTERAQITGKEWEKEELESLQAKTFYATLFSQRSGTHKKGNNRNKSCLHMFHASHELVLETEGSSTEMLFSSNTPPSLLLSAASSSLFPRTVLFGNKVESTVLMTDWLNDASIDSRGRLLVSGM